MTLASDHGPGVDDNQPSQKFRSIMTVDLAAHFHDSSGQPAATSFPSIVPVVVLQTECDRPFSPFDDEEQQSGRWPVP